MAAIDVTHKFIEGKPRLAGKVGAGGVASPSATTIPHTFIGLTEGNVYVVTANRTDATGSTKNPVSSTETFIGKVSSANFINCVRAVEGSAQAWAADTVLEILFTAAGWNKLIEGIEVEHNQDGTHKIANVVTPTAVQTLTNKTLTSPKINEDVAVTATATEINLLDGKTALGAFWDLVPGTPTRVSDTQFTLTDTGNANKYDLLLKKGVILKWDEAGTTNIAMVISSSYATNVVTVNVVGDSLTAGFTSMKYCIQMALVEQFIITGTLGTGTDLAKTWYPSYDVCKLSVDARVKTAGTTNATTFDVNDDGTTIITTKPSIATTETSDIDNVCDAPTTVIAANSAVTVDVDAVSTTPPVEAYIYLFYFPASWLYRN